MKTCKKCKKKVANKSKICKYCGADVSKAVIIKTDNVKKSANDTKKKKDINNKVKKEEPSVNKKVVEETKKVDLEKKDNKKAVFNASVSTIKNKGSLVSKKFISFCKKSSVYIKDKSIKVYKFSKKHGIRFAKSSKKNFIKFKKKSLELGSALKNGIFNVFGGLKKNIKSFKNFIGKTFVKFKKKAILLNESSKNRRLEINEKRNINKVKRQEVKAVKQEKHNEKKKVKFEKKEERKFDKIEHKVNKIRKKREKGRKLGKTHNKYVKPAIIIVIIFLFLGMFVILGLDVYHYFSGDHSIAQVSQKATRDKVFGMNDVISYNDVDYKIVKVETSNGNAYKSPKEGNQFLIVTVYIKNNSSKKMPYSYENWTMSNSKGEENKRIFTSINVNDALYSGKLVIGGIKTGSMVFEQPINDSKLKMNYYDLTKDENGNDVLDNSKRRFSVSIKVPNGKKLDGNNAKS